MSEKVKFNFLEFESAEDGEGRNGYSLQATPGLMKDIPLMTEYLKYGVGNGREITVKQGPELTTLLKVEELDVYGDAPSNTKIDIARQIAEGLIKYHNQNPFDEIRIEYPHRSITPQK